MTTEPTPEPVLTAPFTSEQVDALNAFQKSGRMHPFTCGGEHVSGGPYLVARRDGWHCSDPYAEGCGYTQNWAHAFMADPGAWPAPFPAPTARPTPASVPVQASSGTAQDGLADTGTEFVQQTDSPDWDAIEAAEAETTEADIDQMMADGIPVQVITGAPQTMGSTPIMISVVTPVPADATLRDRIRSAIHDADDHWCNYNDGADYDALTTAVLAAVQPEVDRAETAEAALARVREQCAEWLQPTNSRSWDAQVRDSIASGCAHMILTAIDGEPAGIDRPAMHRAAVQQIREAAGRLLYLAGARVLDALDEPDSLTPSADQPDGDDR
jgi:hypothetical protein